MSKSKTGPHSDGQRQENQMRAVRATEFGGPEVLETITTDDPVPGPGQVVIAVSVVDTLFLDTVIRSGAGRDFFPVTPPYIPGGAVLGRVVATGSGVAADRIGQTVTARTGFTGAYAEKVAVDAEKLVAVPDSLAERTAGGLLSDAVTALGLTEALPPRPGEWVLITAAAGGMGTLLVQLAAASGARVVGAARGERKLTLAKELGAEVAVDYSEQGWTRQVLAATGADGPALVLDGVGGSLGRAAFDIAAHGGRFSAHGTPSGSFTAIEQSEATERGITLRGIQHLQFEPTEVRRLTERALSEAVAGTIRPAIGQTLPLSEAARAHHEIENRGVLGKTLLLP